MSIYEPLQTYLPKSVEVAGPVRYVEPVSYAPDRKTYRLGDGDPIKPMRPGATQFLKYKSVGDQC
jgi:hypothetical protein